MKTVSIQNVRYVAETGHIVAVAKNGVRYEHNQFLNPCKGILVASKIAGVGSINTEHWTVIKSQVMVLAHATARKIVAIEGYSYREALSIALSWIMADVAHAQQAIDTNGIEWSSEYFYDAIFSDGYKDESEDEIGRQIAQLEALCIADSSTVEDVQNLPVMTDAEWDMIENKGCVFTDEEGIDHMVYEPFVPNAPIDMSIPVRDHFAGRSDVKFAMSSEDARAHMLAVLNRTKAQ